MPQGVCTKLSLAHRWGKKNTQNNVAVTFVETCHKTKLLLASEYYIAAALVPSRHRRASLSTETWKGRIPSPERVVSGKWHHILPLLCTFLRRVSSSYIWRVILTSWHTMSFKAFATAAWFHCPSLATFVNVPWLSPQEGLANVPWAAIQLGQHLLEAADFCLLWPCAETVCFLIQVHSHVQCSRIPRLCEQLVTWYVWLP